ncbi:hypothetical protein MHO82_09195 [Vibrio sp. Of7-15]|uniref:tetratricopeptide repeat protein n=1 Tax=Vibrio sp. Of7-15 TaxID=2724879 RepID=UPI001EF2E34B|nr:hypothetical protein [Vibrio sp. Of7-15]
MSKFLMGFIVLLLLSGCVDSSSKSSSAFQGDRDSTESLLLKTKNYSRLIEMYKSDLKEEDTKDTRVKLAKTYLAMEDAESALFYLSTILLDKERDAEIFYLQAQIQYDFQQNDKAMKSVQTALSIAPDYPDAHNLMGILYADSDQFELARIAFNQARLGLADDVKVKNNIAVLDIIEKDYRAAISRLLPLYLNGQADDQVKANLLIAMSKMGNYDYVKSILSKDYEDEEIIQLFHSLNTLGNPADFALPSEEESKIFQQNESNLESKKSNGPEQRGVEQSSEGTQEPIPSVAKELADENE